MFETVYQNKKKKSSILLKKVIDIIKMTLYFMLPLLLLKTGKIILCFSKMVKSEII